MNKPIILVVDDEDDARSTLINFLSARYECDFEEAKDGDEAIDYVRKNPCDVMLLDIKMPRKSGISVIKETKDIKPNVDILIISAWVSEDVAEEAMKLGATDYAVKPLNLKAISLKFENILNKRKQKISKT